jgi:hypothetical protein
VSFWDRSPLKDGLSAIVPPLPPSPKDPVSLHVVHISAELAPIAKVCERERELVNVRRWKCPCLQTAHMTIWY